MTEQRSKITSHVLDAALGHPARGVRVCLQQLDGGEWTTIGEAATDADGRATSLGPKTLPIGQYKIIFDTAAYFASTERNAFYPEVVIIIEITEPDQHYHVPLLLSPYAYSTYRGS